MTPATPSCATLTSANHTHVLWLAQHPTAAPRAAAERAANDVGLPLKVREVGDEALERQLGSLLK